MQILLLYQKLYSTLLSGHLIDDAPIQRIVIIKKCKDVLGVIRTIYFAYKQLSDMRQKIKNFAPLESH